MKKLKLLFLIVPIFLVSACNNSTKEASNETIVEEPAPPTVDTTEGLFVIITTVKGTMIGKLFPDKAPMTVANFVALAEGSMPNTFRKPGQPYYDSLKFHRVISFANGDQQNFMIQGGDPTGTGSGGPGYQFKDEFSDLKLDRAGLFAMANSGPATNGSQFFITLGPTPWLDGVHTVFGELISGTEVPFLIKTNDYMTKIKILRKGDKALKYDALTEFNKFKKAS
ncbi:MAG: peptidylprolyl isomerase [Bacteroidia bacterium]